MNNPDKKPQSNLLDMVDLSVRFGPFALLERVSLTVGAGEIIGIAGESGSGKSTLCRAAMALLPQMADISGSLYLNGQLLPKANCPSWTKRRGRDMAMIFQNPASHLNPLQRIGWQIASPMLRHLGLTRREAWQKAVQLLEDVGIREPLRCARAFAHELSGGMKQRAMIACAISCGAKLLFADEPTTALDVTVQAKILELLQQLSRSHGIGIVLVSHDLAVLSSCCARIAIMQGGRIVEQGNARQMVDAPQNPYSQLLLASQPARLSFASTTVAAEQSPLLEVSALRVVFRQRPNLWSRLRKRRQDAFVALEQVDLQINAGETVGIVGESGSGKSTLARAVIRQNPLAAGSIRFDGQWIAGSNGAKHISQRQLSREVQMVFQNPYDSLNPRLPVLEAIAEPIWRHGLQTRRNALKQAEHLLESVELPKALGSRRPQQLSGGQCQRVGIARALALKPRLLIADEITSALDVTTQAQILELLKRLQREQGLTLLYISHDLSVVSSFCQRLYVFCNGKIVESGAAADVLGNPQQPYTRNLVASIPSL